MRFDSSDSSFIAPNSALKIRNDWPNDLAASGNLAEPNSNTTTSTTISQWEGANAPISTSLQRQPTDHTLRPTTRTAVLRTPEQAEQVRKWPGMNRRARPLKPFR